MDTCWITTIKPGNHEVIRRRGDAGTNPSHQRWFLPVSATRLRRYRCAVSRDERHCAVLTRSANAASGRTKGSYPAGQVRRKETHPHHPSAPPSLTRVGFWGVRGGTRAARPHPSPLHLRWRGSRRVQGTERPHHSPTPLPPLRGFYTTGANRRRGDASIPTTHPHRPRPYARLRGAHQF